MVNAIICASKQKQVVATLSVWTETKTVFYEYTTRKTVRFIKQASI